MIIIADTHAGLKNGLGPEFLSMLKALENSAEDVVFLGDIFDLWIGYARYEDALHRDFLDWCRTQKARRKIYFIEGNHEFFINAKRRAAFSVYDSNLAGYRLNDMLFIHGDVVNFKDKGYLRFRGTIKSRIMAFFVRFTPCGPRIVHYFKESLKKNNRNFRKFIPKDEIMAFAEKARAQNVNTVFIGHFHHGEIIRANGLTVCMVPDWFKTRMVARFNPLNRQIDFLPWQEALAL